METVKSSAFERTFRSALIPMILCVLLYTVLNLLTYLVFYLTTLLMYIVRPYQSLFPTKLFLKFSFTQLSNLYFLRC